jgi:hypothetical protein
MVRSSPFHKVPEILYRILEEEGFFEDGHNATLERELRRVAQGGRSRVRMPLDGWREPRASSPRRRTKKKRKVSAYQKEFGRQLKKLKKKHPRTPVTRLMKRAHAATKRARRGK